MNEIIDIERRSHWAAELDAAEKRRMDIEWNVFIIGLGFVMGYLAMI